MIQRWRKNTRGLVHYSWAIFWTLTELHFIHKFKVKQQQKLGGKGGVTWSWGRRGSVCLWEISLYSHSVITEVCVCDRVCVFWVDCLRNALRISLGLQANVLSETVLKRYTQKTHTHTHSSCTQFAQHTLTNSSLTRSNTTWHKHHNRLLPFSLVCPSFPNTEMSVLASKPVSPLHSISVRIMTLLLLLFVLKQPSIYTQQWWRRAMFCTVQYSLLLRQPLSAYTWVLAWHTLLILDLYSILSDSDRDEERRGKMGEEVSTRNVELGGAKVRRCQITVTVSCSRTLHLVCAPH